MFVVAASNILAFIFAIGLIIFVHEAGHYLAGRFFGVRVLTFSLGFGKRIWGVRRGDTDYRIAAIPLGGYVAFAGQEPGRTEMRSDDFVAKPRWQRIIIYFAGPAMNVVLAVLLVAGVFMAGIEIVNEKDIEPVVGIVLEDSAADRAGLAAGDRLLAIDGETLDHWQAVSMTLLTSPGRELAVEFERDGEKRSTSLTPSIIPKYELGEAGIGPAVSPRVARVVADSPAERAGFQYADALLSVDGVPITSAQEFTERVGPRAGETLAIEVERDGERLVLEVAPKVMPDSEGRGIIGVSIAYFQFQRLGFADAFRESVRYNIDTMQQIGQFVGKIFERRISAKSAIGGPIEIAKVTGQAARLGFRELLFLMALISVNLFLINLLPIPILDGGQILILAVESVLRRDLSLAMKERLIQVGLVIIVSLMAMALYFDVMKTLPAREQTQQEEPGVAEP